MKEREKETKKHKETNKQRDWPSLCVFVIQLQLAVTQFGVHLAGQNVVCFFVQITWFELPRYEE